MLMIKLLVVVYGSPSRVALIVDHDGAKGYKQLVVLGKVERQQGEPKRLHCDVRDIYVISHLFLNLGAH